MPDDGAEMKVTEKQVPPLRFAPVGMTNLFCEFLRQHTSSLLEKSEEQIPGGLKRRSERQKIRPYWIGPAAETVIVLPRNEPVIFAFCPAR
jgi:hypothetical protein